MEWKFERGTFVRLEADALALLSSLRASSDAEVTEPVQSICTIVAFLLCGLFYEEAATRPYWVDDLTAQDAYLSNGLVVLAPVVASCGDHRAMWKVPAELLLGFTDDDATHLESLTVRIGDKALGTLKAHRGARVAPPDEWLHEFRVLPPEADPDLDVARLEARLEEWVTSHGSRPLVDADWQPCSREAATAFIRARVAEGEPVVIEETWLDGGPALWVH